MKPISRYKETLERVIAGDYDGASDHEKREAIKDIIQMCSVAAGAVAIQPVPLLDVVLISPIQIGMVQAVGRIHGHKLDKTSVLEILGTFGASLVAQNVIMAAAKLIPFVGWIIAPSMAYALTYAIGEVSDYYFSHGRGVPESELKAMFKEVFEQKKTERQAAYKEAGSLKQRLTELTEAFEAGLITADEFEQKKQDVLNAF